MTAVIELGAGLVLLLVPSAAISILLGTPLDAPAAVVVARVAGAALLSLGAACWLVRADGQHHGAAALVAAMCLYNSAVALLLVYADLMGLRGWGLWPAVLVHLAMAIWCVVCLRTGRQADRPDLRGRR